MKIVVIDGQGGKMGKGVIEQLKRVAVQAEIFSIGTNSIATSMMMKAGADFGATGENPVLVNCRDADLIIGPIGIVIADSLFGEVTPAMAIAVGQSRGVKMLLPVNQCNNIVIGVNNLSLTTLIDNVVTRVQEMLR